MRRPQDAPERPQMPYRGIVQDRGRIVEDERATIAFAICQQPRSDDQHAWQRRGILSTERPDRCLRPGMGWRPRGGHGTYVTQPMQGAQTEVRAENYASEISFSPS